MSVISRLRFQTSAVVSLRQLRKRSNHITKQTGIDRNHALLFHRFASPVTSTNCSFHLYFLAVDAHYQK
jgi:hypothetical protein